MHMRILSWVLRTTAAVILLQTLYFKFTGAEESVFIFSTLGAEPWGRYGSGLVELAAAIALFVPAMSAFGGVMAVGIAGGALVSHLTVLGIEIRGDGGLLFGLAATVLVCGLGVTAIHRRELPFVGALLDA
jgi:putative oxidoreductase